MNAADIQATRPAVAAPHRTHVFRMLLRRELWEHRGGFVWAPLVAGGIFLLLTLMGVGAAALALGRAGVNINGHSVSLGQMIQRITVEMSAGRVDEAGGIIDLMSLLAAAWPFMVLTFVAFFYCLGSLYDERKDRSVLFWKSLPVSDGETVLSKVASAVLVAPAIAVAAGIVTMFGFLLIASLLVLIHGGNPVNLIWGPGHPFRVAAYLVASIPLYALWALPTVGWLMLCSAWARSKPFLWAIMIPVFAGIFVSWFDLLQSFDMPSTWFWRNVVARALLGTAPTGWTDALNLQIDGNIDQQLASLRNMYASVFSPYAAVLSPKMWVGALAGAAMIFAAARLRRWRDEG